jgi:hypothetical protein
LRQLVLDEELRLRMAQAARERAGDFSVARMVDGLEGLYQRLCERPATPAVRRPMRTGKPYFETPTGL